MPRFLWTQKQDFGPQPRMAHAMSYDSNRQRTVLFGGADPKMHELNDTWEWDGELWTQTADNGPAKRRHAAMAFDGVRSVCVLFGGLSGQPTLGDTWQWDGMDWTQVADKGPLPRLGHGLVYDAARKQTILFGGTSNEGPLNDTWAFDGEAWTQVDETGPSSRYHHCMAYDSVRERVVLFGGLAGGSLFGDTWEWDGAAWSQTADFGPTPLFGASMIFMKTRTVLFGGMNTAGQGSTEGLLNRTWEWSGKHWTQRQDIGPSPRWGHQMAFDTRRSSVVLFGGLISATDPAEGEPVNVLSGDTWEHLDQTPPEEGEPSFSIAVFSLSQSAAKTAEVANVTATVVLKKTAWQPVPFELGFIAAADMKNPSPDGRKLTHGPKLVVAAGEMAAQVPLGANVVISEETLVVLLYDGKPPREDNGIEAYASLTITP